ncbi:redoxin domain-containing protein [Klebsiella pneumoniae]|uniref:redoxin domain-containing protein n=1 Tax=Klebsiella pneumoniae TaxID=573 RepID=UPI003B5B24DE
MDLPKGRLQPGDPAPNFTLRALDGSLFSLGERRGKKTLLAFFRHAGCPFCNFRLHELIQAYPALRAAGVEPVGVFGSPLETLRTRAGRQNPPSPSSRTPTTPFTSATAPGRASLASWTRGAYPPTSRA